MNATKNATTTKYKLHVPAYDPLFPTIILTDANDPEGVSFGKAKRMLLAYIREQRQSILEHWNEEFERAKGLMPEDIF